MRVGGRGDPGSAGRECSARGHPPVAVALAACLVLVSGCGEPSSADEAARVDSAGVEIVTSSGEDRLLEWSFETDLVLGGQETGEQSFFRVSWATVATDSAGRIHVLDPDASRVVVFDAEGAPIRSVGSPGEGPGEMTRPLAFAVTPAGVIYVFDIGKRGIVRFGPAGDTLPELTLPFPFFGGRMDGASHGIILDTSPPGRTLSDRVLLRVSEAGDTVSLATHSVPAGQPLQLESCGMGLPPMARIFDPLIRWDAAGRTVALVRSAAYDVEILDGSELRRRVRRDIPPRPATRELAVRDQGEGLVIRVPGGERVCDPGEVVDKRGFAERVPSIAEVLLTPEGGLWVTRRTIGDGKSPIDVFDETGEYVGTLPAGIVDPVGFLPDGRVLAAERDELDVERLVVRRIVRQGDS